MSDFKVLHEPRRGTDGWYVAAHHDLVGWLTIDGDISRDTSTAGLLQIFHKTERNAHKAIWEYYRKHGLVYTYTCTEKEDVNESQVMRFD